MRLVHYVYIHVHILIFRSRLYHYTTEVMHIYSLMIYICIYNKCIYKFRPFSCWQIIIFFFFLNIFKCSFFSIFLFSIAYNNFSFSFINILQLICGFVFSIVFILGISSFDVAFEIIRAEKMNFEFLMVGFFFFL